MTVTTMMPTEEIQVTLPLEAEEYTVNETVSMQTPAAVLEASAESRMSLPAALCDEALIKEINAIPNKMGFKIGEVADMLGIKQYVLRYWESEFDVLKPKKAGNNQRYYTRKDVENAYIVRKLLHRDRFSIEGARAALKDVKAYVKKEKDWNSINNRIENIHDRLDDLIMDIRRTKSLFL